MGVTRCGKNIRSGLMKYVPLKRIVY